MYQSLFGFQSREAQLRATSAKSNAAPPACSHQSRDSIPSNPPPPPYSKLPSKRRVAVAMTSGTDTFLGTKILLALRKLHIESHLVVSTEAGSNLQRMGMEDVPVHNLADNIYSEAEFDAAMVREGIPLDAMVVVPCDNTTLASIASGLGSDMITRVAGLMLAKRQGLVLIFGENPYNETHLKHLIKVSREGGLVIPPSSTFSNESAMVDRVADEIVGSVVDAVLDSSVSDRNPTEAR